MRSSLISNLAKALAKILLVWALTCLLLILFKPLFLAVYLEKIAPEKGYFATLYNIIIHGFRMDSSVAGYVSVLPAILTAFQLSFRQKFLRTAEKIWYAVAAAIVSAVYIVDIVLFDYWGFRLDATPLFYFTSSPSAALASAKWWQILLSLLAWLAVSAGLYAIYCATVCRISIVPVKKKLIKLAQSIIFIVVCALLIIPIRGGISVSTTNISSAYFSQNQGENQAAINPIFSFLFSLTHQDNIDTQFRYFDSKEAEEVFKKEAHSASTNSDSLLINKTPDIYIIILESFSSHLFPSVGGEAIATKLDSIANNSVSFTNFYASGFRTDRGIPAILSGFPAQPTTSVMKYVGKAAHLPSISSSLKSIGYDAHYYYGGDACFTNMQAYLINSGFSKIISDKDFPVTQKLSKWGAHDDKLFEKVKSGVDAERHHPMLRVIQTSSSHEPFEVPYKNARFSDNIRANAFAFTDSCAADFINYIARDTARWNKSLILVTADHYGAYPERLDYFPDRFKIPFFITGGAIKIKQFPINKIASQTDIAATLLSLLGIENTEFEFSRNIFNNEMPGYAVLIGRNELGYIDDFNIVSYNIDSDNIVLNRGKDTAHKLKFLKAYIQTVYSRISNLDKKH